MAKDDLTNALFEKKGLDRKSAPSPRDNSPTPLRISDLPFRERSFDTFFTFGTTLLLIAGLSQLLAIVVFR